MRTVDRSCVRHIVHCMSVAIYRPLLAFCPMWAAARMNAVPNRNATVANIATASGTLMELDYFDSLRLLRRTRFA